MLYSFRNPEDTETQTVDEAEKQHFEDLGWTLLAQGDDAPDPEAVPVNGVWEVPLAMLQARAWKKLQACREVKRYAGCNTSQGRIQNDPASQAKLTSTVVLADKIPGFTVGWKLENNTVVNCDATQLTQMGIAMGQFDAAVFAFAENVRTEIYNTMAREELEAFKPEDLSWPT